MVLKLARVCKASAFCLLVLQPVICVTKLLRFLPSSPPEEDRSIVDQC